MKESRNTLNSSELNTTTSWSKHDTHWVLSLFGTAVGAGILFLPINLGIGGFWPLVAMAFLAFPMTYLAHRGLARFVLSSKIKNADFTDVVEEHFGARAGRSISLLYFLSIFPILLIYGVGITNTVDSFMVNQAGMEALPRELLSGVLVFALIAIMMAGEKVMLRAFAVMVYPLVAILAFLSFYLMPNWTMPVLDTPDMGAFASTMWLAVPVVIFSFSHAAAISSFANVQRRHYGDDADAKAELILRRTSIMLIAFVLLFVFSCVLALSPEQLAQAKAQNVSVLSYLANATDNPFIATLGPLVAFVAITSSFLGHFLGARESLNGLITKHSNLSETRVDRISVVVLFLSIWAAAIMNPSILGMMEALSGPVIAMILFIMPMLAVHKIESMKQYRGKISTYFVLITGIVAVSALVFSLLS
ncbi:aromatic amino acid transport family protein [Vibrio parahaemolyticus]|uniref:aromatic amino acid transport family protein n=1 Tax=Vibrio parahaemolyticus TaxID=670 RepID=UPI001120A8C6|nr:aromatic amino acid transport family protein [Vibrio parahaemolyticus]TOB21660.1 HAAAP family serine/threonine permease [Vibrio parahaemolyticus]